MTETLIPWAPGAQYTRLVCRLGIPKADGSDEDDLPGLQPQGGRVQLSCSVPRVSYRETDGFYRTLIMETWNLKIRPEDGSLINLDGSKTEVKILSARTLGIDPSTFFWTATITPDVGPQWKTQIPANAGELFDLSSVPSLPIKEPTTPPIDSRIAALEGRIKILESRIGSGGGSIPDPDPEPPVTSNLIVTDNGDGTSSVLLVPGITVDDRGDGTSTMHLTASVTNNGDGTTTISS